MPNDSATVPSNPFPFVIVDDDDSASSQTDVTQVKFVEVYVRKGSDNHERWLSFTIPEFKDPGMLWDFQSGLIAKGIAIDGNQALWSLSRTLNLARSHNMFTENPSKYEFRGAFGAGFTLPDALVADQNGIADWLKDHDDYLVIFR